MKTPDPTNAESSAPNSAKFTGTDNPRHLRAIDALLRRPIPVKHWTASQGPATRQSLLLSCGAVVWRFRASASASPTATAKSAALASTA